MGKHVIELFHNAYKKTNNRSNNLIRCSMLNSIPTMLGEEENNELREKVSEEEVRKAVFSLKAYKALGLHGFPPAFFNTSGKL